MRIAVLPLVAALLALGACGDRHSVTSIRIVLPEDGWATSIAFDRKDDREHLVVDGIVFELRDPAAYLLDWEAVGMSGIQTTSSFTYESTEPVEGAFLAVGGRSVEVVDGVLRWGDEDLGPVAEGDHVIVDAEGVRIAR